MLFVLAVLLCVAGLAYQFGFLSFRRKIARTGDWNTLIESVEAINLEAVRDIADAFLQPTKDQLRLEPPVMWEMLGGMEGLRQMSRNADRMLELCVYAEKWDHQGSVISEMVRLDAVNLKKAVRQIEMSLLMGMGRVRGHFALMEAAAHYELMRRRLLGQYEKSHVGRLPLLQARLGA